MLVADEFLGTLADEGVAGRVETGDPLTVTVDDTERRRSRFRTTADDGTDLGVVVGRELEDGDVLAAGDRLVVVSLEPVDAMVVDFTGVADPDRAAVTTALELGHAVGNRHWDLAIDGARNRAYMPVTDSRDRMEATVEPALPAGATIGYEAVPPTTFDESSGGHGHSHEHGPGHSHGPDSGHTRGDDSGHTHGDGTGHAHRDGTGNANEHGVRSIDPDRGDDDA